MPAGHALEVARDLLGVHAQLMSSAELTLWTRVAGLEQKDVATALWTDRKLVKTWAMRGTLHLIEAGAFPAVQAAQSVRRHYERPSWQRAFGVTLDELETLMAAVSKALASRPLTRDELADKVARLTGSKTLGGKLRESWGALLKPAAYRGLLCFAPNRGRKVCFTRPDLWLADWQAVDPERAVAEQTRRFFTRYGPASSDDYARWWGAFPPETRAALQSIDDELVDVDVEGFEALMLAGDVADVQAAKPVRTVRLLPAFDQHVAVLPKQARAILPSAAAGRIYRPQGWLSPVLYVDGRMAGVWRHETKGGRVVVEVEPFATVSKRVRTAVDDEAGRLARFLGGGLELAWSG